MIDPVTASAAASRHQVFQKVGRSALIGLRNILLLLVALTVFAFASYDREQLASVTGAMARWIPVMFQGFLFNILVSILAMAIGTLLGAGLGLGQVSQIGTIRRVSTLVTQFFRNAPWLVLLFYCIFLIPFEINILGTAVPFPSWIKATIGLCLPVMGNVSEIVRGAIQSLPTGQWESSQSLGLTQSQVMRLVILPQCVKPMLPPWMNVYAILTMATPLMSVVGVDEVMSITRSALAAEGRTDLLMPMYLTIMSWFFLYCYPIARLTVELERRFRVLK